MIRSYFCAYPLNASRTSKCANTILSVPHLNHDTLAEFAFNSVSVDYLLSIY